MHLSSRYSSDLKWPVQVAYGAVGDRECIFSRALPKSQCFLLVMVIIRLGVTGQGKMVLRFLAFSVSLRCYSKPMSLMLKKNNQDAAFQADATVLSLPDVS